MGSVIDFLIALGWAIWYVLPAYIANAMPTILGGGVPIDGGKKMGDGRPVFGSHKTVRGFGVGVLFGSLVGFVQAATLGPILRICSGILQGLGAMLGDLAGSFIKRRKGIKPGDPFPLLDQLDFVLGAVALSYLVEPFSLITFLLILSITPPLHVLTNVIAYLLKIKEKPW